MRTLLFSALLFCAAPLAAATVAALAPAASLGGPLPVVIHIPLGGDLVLTHPVESPDWPSLPERDLRVTMQAAVAEPLTPAQPAPILPAVPVVPVAGIPGRLAPEEKAKEESPLAAMRRTVALAQEALKPKEGEEKPAPENVARTFDGASASPSAAPPAEAAPAEEKARENPPPPPRPARRRVKKPKPPSDARLNTAPEWELERDLGIRNDDGSPVEEED